MKKIKVIDLLCDFDESDLMRLIDEKDFWDSMGCDNWLDYYESLCECSLDMIDFNIDDIEKDVFVIDDGVEIIKLKSECYMCVCWRDEVCRVWKCEDDELVEFVNELCRK